MKVPFLSIFLLVCTLCSFAQTCPIYGDKPVAKYMILDSMKNRSAVSEGDEIDSSVTLEKILSASEDDTNDYNSSQLVELTGYVIKVKYGAGETCNCHSKKKTDLDIHIELALSPDAGNADAMVVEINRYTRAQYPDRTTVEYLKQFVGKKVTVTGYMLFDTEHTNNAVTTNPNGAHNWRYTCWEVHPVLHLKPADQ